MIQPGDNSRAAPFMWSDIASSGLILSLSKDEAAARPVATLSFDKLMMR